MEGYIREREKEAQSLSDRIDRMERLKETKVKVKILEDRLD